MNENIERNRRRLLGLCSAGRIMGLALIVMPVLTVGWAVFIDHAIGAQGHGRNIVALRSICEYLFFGLLVLGIAQFIRLLIEKDCQPGWILRHGHLLLCFFAVCRPLTKVAMLYFVMGLPNVPGLGWGQAIMMVSSICVEMLILLGMAAALRLALPIIAESKTLA